jgi:hypothetical protein
MIDDFYSRLLCSFRLERVDCGSDQGRRANETAGAAALPRGFQLNENADMSRKMPFPVGN